MSWQNGLWLIQRDVSKDEITESYPPGTDFISLRKTFFERIKRAEIADKEMALAMRNSRTASEREHLQNMKPRSNSYRTWDNTKCRNYALAYSSNDPGTSSYNPRFIFFAGADCQNFVSQCIWYSFGGIDEIGPIESHALPMIDNSIPAKTWWCDSAGTSTYSSNPILYYWIYVPHFNSMVTWNYSHDAVGLQCSTGSLSGLMIGDYVKYKDGSHVFIISSIVDADHDYNVDFNEIYVCAHTNNHRDVRLVDIPVSSAVVDLMWVRRFKDPIS